MSHIRWIAFFSEAVGISLVWVFAGWQVALGVALFGFAVSLDKQQ